MRRPCDGIIVGAMALCLAAFAQEFRQDFETDTGGAFSYHKPPEALTIERMQGDAASGQWHLRAVLPGKKKLEGIGLTATGLSGGRLATVTAAVRGKGEIWLCLLSGNGWLYSPTRQRLTDQWQEISLSKVLIASDRSLGIYFLSQDVQPGAIFEIDNVRVTLAPPLPTWDVAVGPWRLEAEDFASQRRTIMEDRQASGGYFVRAEAGTVLADLPCPRTSRPLYIFALVRSSEAKDAWRLITWQGGLIQYLRTQSATRSHEWEWLRFGPLLAGELGESFGLGILPALSSVGGAIDCLVIATEEELTPQQLAAAPNLLGRRPLALVGRSEQEAPFGPGSVISGFIAVGSRRLAEAQTEARLAYDDSALHIRFDCVEPLLDTAAQRRHEFRANVRQRDGDLYADDCVIVLLQPPGSQFVYEFVVNALGALADARALPTDLWETRDLSWDSRATTRAEIGEKQWQAELHIPWEDLGQRPKAGDCWNVILARSARGRREQSAWTLTGRGIHDPLDWGALVFAETAPSLTGRLTTKLQPRGNSMPLQGNDPAGRVLCFAEICSADGLRHFYASSFDLPPAAGELQAAYGALDAASLQPLLLTPLLPLSVQFAEARLALMCDGPYELFVNGERIAGGASAEGIELALPLQKGANVLALRLSRGTAALRGRVGDWLFDGEGCKIAADTPEALSPAWDDDGCPAAPIQGRHPRYGPIVGRPGEAVVLRRTLLYEKTRVWPTPEPAFYLAQGVTQHLTFLVEGLPGRALRQWETFIAVPEGFEIVGSTGFYGKNPGVPKWHTTPLGLQDVLGQKRRVYKIATTEPIAAGRHYIMSEFEAFVRVAEKRKQRNAGRPAEESTTFLFWSRAEGGNVIEAPQTIRVQVLPSVRGAQSRRLIFQLWGSWLANMDDLAMREQILAAAQRAGFNDIVAGDRWTSDHARRYGLRHTASINFEPWALNLKPYLEQHPAERLVDAAGKPRDELMCPGILLTEGWNVVRELLRQKIEAVRPDTLDYDYEYPPFSGPHSCYCPRCLQAFREFAHLPASEALNAELIRSRYRAHWIDFMAQRVAQIFALFRKTIHELAPGTHFSVYSGYATPDNPERYGVDWRYVGELQACDHAGCGYGRPSEAIAATKEALRGVPLVCGLLLTPYDRDVLTPATALTKAWLLRMLLDSTGGILVYERTTMDGRSWLAMGEITRLVARFEEIFLRGQHLFLPELPPASVEALQLGRTTLVCFLNTSSQPLSLKATLPREWGGGEEFYSGRKISAGAALDLLLPPGEAQIFVLRR